MTTKIAELIVNLQNAEGPDRLLDTAIAILFGYEQREVAVPGKDGKKGTRMHWFRPRRDTPVRVPRYTGNIDVAKLEVYDLHTLWAAVFRRPFFLFLTGSQ